MKHEPRFLVRAESGWGFHLLRRGILERKNLEGEIQFWMSKVWDVCVKSKSSTLLGYTSQARNGGSA